MQQRQYPAVKEVAKLIREIASLYVMEPDRLVVETQESSDGRAVYFQLKGSPDDDSRLVGREGCHVNALRFLIDRVGKAQDRAFTFRLHTRRDGISPWHAPKDVLAYDPGPIRDLISRWVSTLGFDDFVVSVGPGPGARTSLSFDFNISIPDEDQVHEMIQISSPETLSIFGALGTLLRAAARQNGCRFQVNVR